MECRGVGPRAEDPMIGLFFAAGGDAGGDEAGFEILFVGGGEGMAEDGRVGGCGDGVGVADEGDFVGGFGDAAGVDCGLEEGGVCGREEGDDLMGGGRMRGGVYLAGGGKGGQVRGEVGFCETFVNVVF